MKIYLLTFLFFLSCKEVDKKQAPIHVVDNLKKVGKRDSIYLSMGGHIAKTYGDTITHMRFFLVSYSTRTKKTKINIEGNINFSSTVFPNNRELDSSVFSYMPFKRNCYDNLIIVSILEFKNEFDYDSYILNMKSDEKPKKQSNCD